MGARLILLCLFWVKKIDICPGRVDCSIHLSFVIMQRFFLKLFPLSTASYFVLLSPSGIPKTTFLQTLFTNTAGSYLVSAMWENGVGRLSDDENGLKGRGSERGLLSNPALNHILESVAMNDCGFLPRTDLWSSSWVSDADKWPPHSSRSVVCCKVLFLELHLFLQLSQWSCIGLIQFIIWTKMHLRVKRDTIHNFKGKTRLSWTDGTCNNTNTVVFLIPFAA